MSHRRYILDMNYLELNNSLLDAGAVQSPASVHGFICALFVLQESELKASRASSAIARSQGELMSAVRIYAGIDLPSQYGGDASDLRGSPCPELEALVELAGHELTLADARHYPLIPSDESDIHTRLQALAEWARGFLEGFAKQCDSQSAVSQERADFVKELAQIAALDLEEQYDEATQNKAEQMLSELVEHIKISLYGLMLTETKVKSRPRVTKAESSDSPTIQ